MTHNRPELFKRCLRSVLYNVPSNVEILVNNDSRDIEAIPHNQVQYFYDSSDNLSSLYEGLFDRAKGEYIFYLEDDDYLLENFWKTVQCEIGTVELLMFNYYSSKKDMKRYLKFFRANLHLVGTNDFKYFIDNYNDEEFQLSQIIFKRDILVHFPKVDSIDNDFMLFSMLMAKQIKYINKPLWVQTYDGKDNISLKQFCKDERFYEQSCW